MATGVLRTVRARCPRAHLVVAIGPALVELLAGAPWCDAVVPMDLRGALGPWRGGRTLAATRPDAVLLLPNSFRSALAARLSGAPCRIGYARDARGVLLTHRLPTPDRRVPVPAVDYYAELARYALDVETIDTRPELAITAAEREEAARVLDGVPTPFVVLNPGANKPAKRWPATRFAAVADALAERGVAAVVSGGPDERDLCRTLVDAATAPVVDVAARGMSLGGLKGVLERASVLLTNDTGPRHIAVAVGTPTVTLFGPTDPRWTTLLDARERRLVAEPFLPEPLVADAHARLCTIDRITVGDVRAAVESFLDAAPA
jgi:heptosyltransferase-2